MGTRQFLTDPARDDALQPDARAITPVDDRFCVTNERLETPTASQSQPIVLTACAAKLAH
jgi:hypothetical protein